MGQAVAQQLLREPDRLVWAAVQAGQELASRAAGFMARAAALLDPVMAPLAAYVAATRLPPGQDSKPWAVEAVLIRTLWLSGQGYDRFENEWSLVADPLHRSGIMEELTAALSLQQAAAARKQANKLVKKAGGGAAEAEQLRQQLQGMWLGGDTEEAPGLTTPASTATSSSCASPATAAAGHGKLPHILQRMCREGVFRHEEVLAAGDPTRWSSALGPTSEADLRVASTALLAACKAAGAVAQLHQLLEQLRPIMAQQPWGSGVAASRTFEPEATISCSGKVAVWAVLLVRLLAVLLPAQQAAELQEVAAGIQQHARGMSLDDEQATHVLSLLGHVMAPGAPGCSYAGCCNMEGRSEAELPVQACSKCRGVRYCCREHQVAHWKAGHKEVCLAAQAAAQQVKGVADVAG
jgi:hypothetical protein